MPGSAPRHGLARVLSRRGICSRSQAERWIALGQVRVDGNVVRDPEFLIRSERHAIEIDGQPVNQVQPRYLMLNKPRGLVTTTRDERGRDTIYRCLEGTDLPWVAPVGRLDKASEGLLLLSNDPAWAARITDPVTGPDKTYHVQIDGMPEADHLAAMRTGIVVESERLNVVSAKVLRSGGRRAWLEIVLDEGRNRQIRRLLSALGFDVLRLVRVAIGGVALGDLPKGRWRDLSAEDIAALSAR